MRKLILAVVFGVLSISTQAQLLKKGNKEENNTSDSTAAPKEKKGLGLDKIAQKAVGGLAKVAAKAAAATGMGGASTTADLSVVEPYVYLMSNILPKEMGTIDMDFFNGWKSGGDLVGVMFVPKNRAFTYKIDGTVTLDGVSGDYQSTGLYTKVFDHNTKNRVLEIATGNGQKAKFSFEPNANTVKLLSINGQKDNCTIDLTKDFTLELADYTPGSYVSIRIVGTTIGIRSTYSVATVKATSKITLPGYLLKHIGTTNNLNFKNSWLIIDDAQIKEAKDETGFYKTPVKYFAMSSAALPVTFTPDLEVMKPLETKAEITASTGKLKYEFTKENAFGSRPFSQVDKILVTTFSLSGRTEASAEKTEYSGDTQTEYSSYIRLSFPDEKIDAVLAQLYTGITQVLKDELGANVLPAKTALSSKEYQSYGAYSEADKNVTEAFSRSYEGLHKFSATAPLTLSFSGTSNIFDETGSNAQLRVTMNLDLKVSPKTEPKMVPTLKVELIGKKHDMFALLTTKYFSGEIEGSGVTIKNKDIKAMNKGDMSLLDKIVRADDFVSAFKKALQELKAQEKINGEYETVWELQK